MSLGDHVLVAGTVGPVMTIMSKMSGGLVRTTWSWNGRLQFSWWDEDLLQVAV